MPDDKVFFHRKIKCVGKILKISENLTKFGEKEKISYFVFFMLQISDIKSIFRKGYESRRFIIGPEDPRDILLEPKNKKTRMYFDRCYMCGNKRQTKRKNKKETKDTR